MADRVTIGDLERLVNDIAFEKIELTLRQPNIFQALAIERRELSHSNFLAWLLDPEGSHSLGPLVLGKFLRDIFSDHHSPTRTFFDADLLEKRRVEVRREWRNIDILLILPDDVIAIENKVDSRDHSAQLSRYRHIVEETFQDKPHHHFVFLTPYGDMPDEDGEDEFYVCYSYQSMAGIIQRILEVHGSSIPPKIVHYLEDYLVIIRRDLLMTDTLNEMAAKIYQAHREAIDFLFENRPDPFSELYGYFEEALVDAGFKIGSKHKGFIRFATPGLMDCMPRTSEGWPDHEAFLFEIDYKNDKKAYVKAVISPGEAALQQRILGAARSAKDQYPKEWRDPMGTKWLTFYSRNFPLSASGLMEMDPDLISKSVREIVAKVAPVAELICRAVEAEIRQGLS